MRGFPLEQVLQLAERERDAETRSVKRMQGVWLDARSREARALQRVAVARTQLAAALVDGVTGAELADYSRDAEALRVLAVDARAQVAAACAAWLAQLEIWRRHDSRARAMKVLEARWQARLAVRERRAEQRTLDEWATRNRLVAGGRAR